MFQKSLFILVSISITLFAKENSHTSSIARLTNGSDSIITGTLQISNKAQQSLRTEMGLILPSQTEWLISGTDTIHVHSNKWLFSLNKGELKLFSLIPKGEPLVYSYQSADMFSYSKARLKSIVKSVPRAYVAVDSQPLFAAYLFSTATQEEKVVSSEQDVINRITKELYRTILDSSNLKFLRPILKSHPGNTVALLKSAEYELLKGDTQKARSYIENAERIRSNDPLLFQSKANLYRREGKGDSLNSMIKRKQDIRSEFALIEMPKAIKISAITADSGTQSLLFSVRNTNQESTNWFNSISLGYLNSIANKLAVGAGLALYREFQGITIFGTPPPQETMISFPIELRYTPHEDSNTGRARFSLTSVLEPLMYNQEVKVSSYLGGQEGDFIRTYNSTYETQSQKGLSISIKPELRVFRKSGHGCYSFFSILGYSVIENKPNGFTVGVGFSESVFINAQKF